MCESMPASSCFQALRHNCTSLFVQQLHSVRACPATQLPVLTNTPVVHCAVPLVHQFIMLLLTKMAIPAWLETSQLGLE